MKVYLTQKNADMTEGKGPMVNDLCFLNLKDAKDYIDKQSGIMGRRDKWSEKKFGDWIVLEINVFRNLDEIEVFKHEKIKEKALAKLTQEEKEVLGL